MPRGLVQASDFDARSGAGLGRALVLGGGGLFFVAWQVAYLRELERRGVAITSTDRVVGTSAGSIIAASLTGGTLPRLDRLVTIAARRPALLSRSGGTGLLRPSQQRALDLFRLAGDNEPATIREIGRAAMAARTRPPQAMRRTGRFLVGRARWPGAALHVTAVDAYTGERLVFDDSSRVAVPAAIAASSAVPGIFPPQPIRDRMCMDGGVSGSGTHTDLVAGAERALVIALSETFRAQGVARVATMTQRPGAYDAELGELAATGTQVLSRGPRTVDMTQLMAPAAVAGAVAMGRDQAAEDADEIRDFWA